MLRRLLHTNLAVLSQKTSRHDDYRSHVCCGRPLACAHRSFACLRKDHDGFLPEDGRRIKLRKSTCQCASETRNLHHGLFRAILWRLRANRAIIAFAASILAARVTEQCGDTWSHHLDPDAPKLPAWSTISVFPILPTDYMHSRDK